VKWRWGEEEQIVFDELKKAFMTRPVLHDETSTSSPGLKQRVQGRGRHLKLCNWRSALNEVL